MTRNRREAIAVLAGGAIAPATIAGVFVPSAAAETGPELSPEEARAIAKDVFL